MQDVCSKSKNMLYATTAVGQSGISGALELNISVAWVLVNKIVLSDSESISKPCVYVYLVAVIG